MDALERRVELLEQMVAAVAAAFEAVAGRSAGPQIEPLIVGTKEAARILHTSEDRIAELVNAGILATHPDLTYPKRWAFAVPELIRFVQVGMTQTETGRMRVVS